jgi:hypothetical protein
VVDPSPSANHSEPAPHRAFAQRVNVLLPEPVKMSLAALALFVVSLGLVSLHVRAFTKVSPVDEQMHIDYLYRAPGVQPVVSGTRLGPEAMREEACRGIASNFHPPPCGSSTLRPDQFEFRGYDTAYIHPATYYDLTALLAHPLQGILGLASLVTAARLVGALWLWLGLLVTMFVARRFGASLPATVGLLFMAASTPAALFYAATVTPDGMNLLVGAVALSLVLAWETRPRQWWLLVLAATLGVMVKAQGAIVILMLGLYLGAQILPALRRVPLTRAAGAATPKDRPARSRDLVGGVLVLGVVAAVVGTAWIAAVNRNATLRPELQPMNLAARSATFSVQSLTGTLGAFFPPIISPYVPPLWGDSWQQWMQVLIWVLVAGILFWVLFRPSQGRLTALAGATLITGFFGPALLQVLDFLQRHEQIAIPPRYGMTLLPAMLVVTAVAVRSQFGAALLLVVGALNCFAIGWVLAGAA